MSGGAACPTPAHRPWWRVTARRCNYSAFGGYRRTPSEWSEVRCFHPDCLSRWRTRAGYVDGLADATDVERVTLALSDPPGTVTS